ncbi:MAG: DUF739 family protein [Eubacteriales bacterium]
MSRAKIPVSYAKLRGKIREEFGTQSSFAESMGMNDATLSAKLNKRRVWTVSEVEKACELLGIPTAQAYIYFFTPEVAKTQQI